MTLDRTLDRTAVDVLPNPSSSLVLRELERIRREVQRIRNHMEGTTENEGELFPLPLTPHHLRLHMKKWVIAPAGVVTNLALVIGTHRVWTVRTTDGNLAVDLPFTIEPGTDVSIVNAVTGVRVDDDPAVLLSSGIIATVEQGREQQGNDALSGDV